MKLKDDKTCHCPGPEDAERVLCRYGYCTIWRCLTCHLFLWSAGPISCPCKKNKNGTLRWFKYPDMDEKTPVPVKKNKRWRLTGG